MYFVVCFVDSFCDYTWLKFLVCVLICLSCLSIDVGVGGSCFELLMHLRLGLLCAVGLICCYDVVLITSFGCVCMFQVAGLVEMMGHCV